MTEFDYERYADSAQARTMDRDLRERASGPRVPLDLAPSPAYDPQAAEAKRKADAASLRRRINTAMFQMEQVLGIRPKDEALPDAI
ncbi:hypothetical protein [Pseudomonas sp.]|jgi:hypothetical protein|uniref:hypothetical protein n=1 Tax=Pseudomonas sp. TaxID=306 RepID=UPI002ED8AE7E